MIATSSRRPPVAQVLDEAFAKPPKERLAFLEDELRARRVEGELLARESLEALSSSSWETGRFAFSNDDDVVDETSFLDETPAAERSARQIEYERCVGRALHSGNPFAIGAHESRINYTLGTGLRYQLVPRVPAIEVPTETVLVGAALDRVLAGVDPAGMFELEGEALMRADRDGEVFFRLSFPDDGPMAVRFLEPEDVKQPPGSGPEKLHGIETAPGDVRTVIAYWVEGKGDQAGEFQGIPAAFVLHLKFNVELSCRRGRGTMVPIRRHLARAEKLLRNMSFVAALQAAIAVIQKHETATRAEVESYLAGAADLLVNRETPNGKKQVATSMIGPGSMLHAGPGVNFEAPVSSVNAANNVSILQAELRACATRLSMAEFMFSGDASAAPLAATLVAEGPVVKAFQRLQVRIGTPCKAVVQRGLEHEERRGALPTGVLMKYVLVLGYSSLVVRNELQEAQTMQIEQAAGVVSRTTWRAKRGYDDKTEERNLDQEARRGYAVRGAAPVNGTTNQSADPGGASKVDPTNPLTARPDGVPVR